MLLVDIVVPVGIWKLTLIVPMLVGMPSPPGAPNVSVSRLAMLV